MEIIKQPWLSQSISVGEHRNEVQSWGVTLCRRHQLRFHGTSNRGLLETGWVKESQCKKIPLFYFVLSQINYTCPYTYIYVLIWLHIIVPIYIYMYMCVYIHTYIQSCARCWPCKDENHRSVLRGPSVVPYVHGITMPNDLSIILPY